MSIPPTLIMTSPAFTIIQAAQKNSFHHSGSIDTEYHSYWIGFLGNHSHNAKMFHNQAFFWKGSYNTLVCICTNLYHISVHYCEFSSNCCIHFILLVSVTRSIRSDAFSTYVLEKEKWTSSVVSWTNSQSAGMLVSSPVKEGVGWTIIAGFDASELNVVIGGYAMYSHLEVIWEGCCSLILICQAITRYPIIIIVLMI